MTHQRSIEGLLDAWLQEGSNVAPDRVIDIVADRIERQGQRAAWRFPRRHLRMSAPLRIAAVATALAVVGAGAVYFAGSTGPDLGPGPSLPSETMIVSVAPSASPYVLPSAVPDETPHRVSTSESHPGFRVDLPAGWQETGRSSSWFSLFFGPDAAPGGGVTFRINPVLGSTCPDQRSAAPYTGLPMSASASVAALLSDPRLSVVGRPSITIAGRTAQVLDVQLAPDFTGRCGSSATRSARILDAPGSFVVVQGDERFRLILLDVDGVPVLVVVVPTGETADAFFARATGVIERVTFLP